MSWMKHRAVSGSGAPGRPPPTSATPPMPPVQMYNPNQHSTQQQLNSWQQVDLSAPTTTNNSWHDNQQQNNWYPSQQQTYQPPMQQQHYANQQQSTPYYQQQGHYQQPTQTYEQPPTIPQPQPPTYLVNTSSAPIVDNNTDVWNEWNNWGDEDNSNTTQNLLEESPYTIVKQETVEDSFANNQSWNWSADDRKATLSDSEPQVNDLFSKIKLKTEPQNVETTNEDQFVKPVTSETVTPQWSIESQPSQDSPTDDVALLQSDTEQKHFSKLTTPGSTDLTSNSQTSTTTNTTSNFSESKELAFNSHITDSSDLQNNTFGSITMIINPPGHLQQQSQHVVAVRASVSSMAYRNSTAPPDITDVPQSTLLQSERNQYLETGQLLDDNTDSVQAPPPAFSRVVVGQRESNDNNVVRTLPAGSDLGVKTSTYRPRGDTSDEDSAFEDNEPLASQPILPRSATIGAETLLPSQQRDTHLDGANTLDDVQLAPEAAVAVVSASTAAMGEGSSGPESSLTGRMRQLAVSGGESDNNNQQQGAGNDDVANRRSSKHTTNDSSEDLPAAQPPGGDDNNHHRHHHLLGSTSYASQQTKRRSNNHGGRYAPTNDERIKGDNNRRRGEQQQLEEVNGRRGGRQHREEYRRRDDKGSDYDREAVAGGGLFSGNEDGDRMVMRRRRAGDEEETGGKYGRQKRAVDDRDRYHRPRGGNDHSSSYYRPSNKRRDDYDDYYDDELNASRASSRSESLQEVYRGGKRRDRADRDRDGGRRYWGDRDREDREKQGRGGYGPPRRGGDPYAGGSYMQGYYDSYGHPSSAHHAQSYYYQQYQYYENLRVSNPQAYAEWYRKFYQSQQGVVGHQQQQHLGGQRVTGGITTAEERATLHSGRSSANDDLAKERYLRQSYYDGHSAAAAATILHQQHNARAAAYYYRDSASVSSHYGLDDSRQDYPDSATSTHLLNTSTFEPIDTSSTSLSQRNYLPSSSSFATVAQPRLTPAKFSTAHAIASLTTSCVSGHLIHVPVQYPQDSESAVVHLVGLGDVFRNGDVEYAEMVRFPGPLVRGVTHKKTVIEYCESKIRTAREDNISLDCDNYILLWELLILLLSHNGVVVGADISDLLMRHHNRQQHQQLDQNVNRPSSVNSTTSSNICIDQNSTSEASNVNATGDGKLGNNTVGMKEGDAITNKFRQYLIYGSVKEALEWAMKNGLWGHALFLASKLDKRTYANVMKRFANGLPMNDPLQTLYQLLSGSVPAAVTCVAEERWGDWRPHLAMILANSSANPELDHRAILALGDTLDARGSIYGAQFCYLMAQVEFTGGKVCVAGSIDHRLVLLGGDKRDMGRRRYAKTEAIHMTEVYEYACGLNGDGFFIPEFQTYKYMLATRLCDYGLVERSLAYLERIATILIANSFSSLAGGGGLGGASSATTTTNMFHPALVNKVCELADRLRYCDPSDELQQQGEDQQEEEGQGEGGGSGWLKRLMKLDTDYKMGLISHSTNHDVSSDNTPQQNAVELTYDHRVWQQREHRQLSQEQQWQPDQNQQQFDSSLNYQQQQQILNQTSTEGQLINQQQTFWPNHQISSYNDPVSSDVQEHLHSPDSLQWSHTQTEDVPLLQRPQISMPNQSSPRKTYDDNMEDETTSLQLSSGKAKAAQQQSASIKSTTAKNENKGWLDGIFGRFSMRPKNQMKLPDDKNPTIIWDPAKKRWMNTEEDGADSVSEMVPPPPKMADLMPPQQPMSLPVMSISSGFPSSISAPAQPQNGVPNSHQPALGDGYGNTSSVTGKPPIPAGNMFKMQRGRNLKKSYVDVFNPGGIMSGTGGSAPALIDGGGGGNPGSGPMLLTGDSGGGLIPNFFVPQPMADSNAPTNFLTPTTGMPSIDHQHQKRKP